MYCIETRNRIRLLLAAYAYEFESDSIITDSEFDSLALSININLSTGRPILDEWFRDHFSPHTGQWIHSFPELYKLEQIYTSLQKNIS